MKLNFCYSFLFVQTIAFGTGSSGSFENNKKYLKTKKLHKNSKD